MKAVLFKELLHRRSLLYVLITSFLISGCTGSDSNNQNNLHSGFEDKTIVGAGSTLVYPFFSKAFYAYNQQAGIRVNYQPVGSGGGVVQLINNTVDFADTDAPLNKEQKDRMKSASLHIPMCIGAVVLCYNIPGITQSLNLSPEIIAKIFLGEITHWSDPMIVALNKNVQIPNTPILVVHRSDGSGTSKIFTSYLNDISKDWAKTVGKGSAVNWPVGLGGRGNEGIAGLVKEIPGTIGYVELAYADQNGMIYAKVQNKAGKFILPTVESARSAGNVEITESKQPSIVNTPDSLGYPICSYTWAVLYKEQNYNARSRERASALVKLLWYAIHDGQKYCEALHYAPLPPSAITSSETILSKATFDNTSLLDIK